MTRFIVRMDLDITQSQDKIQEFFKDFANLAGILPHEFKNTYIRSGCTLIDGHMDRAAIERLQENFERLKAGSPNDLKDPELIALKKFVDYYRIEVLTDALETNKNDGNSEKPKKALILVHGWGGNKEETFGMLPEFLSANLNIPVKIYEYPTGRLTGSPSVVFIARNLDNWIRNNFPNHEIGLIGHSLGGLVIRYLTVIQNNRKNTVRIIPKQISLVASPTNGTLLATIASKIPILRDVQLNELSPNSGFLVDLNERWVSWKDDYVPSKCRIGTIFGLDDQVVCYTSAIGSDPEAIPIYHADHTNIVKPPDSNHDIVLTLTRLSTEAGICSSSK